jgi:hypothetical protein
MELEQPKPKIWQEIHCPVSGGGCGGFILVKLDVSISRIVTIICPKCKHEHQRAIIDGQVAESGRYNGKSQEELCPTIAAWSETPRTRCMQKIVKDKDYKKEREGAVIKDERDLIAAPFDTAETIIRESWTDRFLGRART